MTAVYSSEISIWVDHYEEGPAETEAKLLADGYAYGTEASRLWKTDGRFLEECRLIGLEKETWAICSRYPAEYECGPRLEAIAATFAVTINQDEGWGITSYGLEK